MYVYKRGENVNIYPRNGVGSGGGGVYYRYHRGRVIKMSLARLPGGPRALHDADVFNTQRFRRACIVREHRAAAPPSPLCRRFECGSRGGGFYTSGVNTATFP